MFLANPTVQVNHFYFQKECVCVAFSISSLLAPPLGTSCQTQRFKLAQSCPLSWDLQRQMLSAYAEAARPQQGSGLQLCQSREVWKTPQRTEELVFLQTTGLSVSSTWCLCDTLSVHSHPPLCYATGRTQSLNSRKIWRTLMKYHVPQKTLCLSWWLSRKKTFAKMSNWQTSLYDYLSDIL